MRLITGSFLYLALLLAVAASTAQVGSAADLGVNLSGLSPGPFSNRLNDADVEVARFVLHATGGDVTVGSVTISFGDPAAVQTSISALRVFYDADGNGTFTAGEQVGTDQTPDGVNGFLTFAGPFTALSTFQRDLQVRADITSNPAGYGVAFQFSIAASATWR